MKKSELLVGIIEILFPNQVLRGIVDCLEFHPNIYLYISSNWMHSSFFGELDSPGSECCPGMNVVQGAVIIPTYSYGTYSIRCLYLLVDSAPSLEVHIVLLREEHVVTDNNGTKWG